MIGLWLTLPVLGPVRASTIATAFAMLAIPLAMRRDLLRSAVAVVAWASVFEILYNLIGVVGFHWRIPDYAWATAALAGWVILAAVLGIWPDWRASVVFVLLMAAWIATGFHSNVAGQARPLDLGGELFNVAAKTSLGLAYLVGALRANNQRKARGGGSLSESGGPGWPRSTDQPIMSRPL